MTLDHARRVFLLLSQFDSQCERLVTHRTRPRIKQHPTTNHPTHQRPSNIQLTNIHPTSNHPTNQPNKQTNKQGDSPQVTKLPVPAYGAGEMARPQLFARQLGLWLGGWLAGGGGGGLLSAG